MTVTEVRRQRRHLYTLVIDGEPAVDVDVSVWDESPYKAGCTLTDEQLHALLTASQERRAKDKALYLLSLRDYARGELEKKLCADAPPEIAAQTAARMEELGLVNDAAYARRLAQDLRLRRQFPYRRAVQELCSRGIAREIAEEAAGEVETDEVQQALALLRKKRYNTSCDADDRRRIAAALGRAGFSYDVIRRAMEAFAEQETAEDG